MINLLNKWIFRETKPVLHDLESTTMMEATGKLHAKMNELITDYNDFVDRVNEQITEFNESANQNFTEFRTGLRQEFQDFIDIIELKYNNLGIDIEKLRADVESNVNLINATTESALAEIDNKTESALETVIDEILSSEPFTNKANLYKADIRVYSEGKTQYLEFPLTKLAKEKKQVTISNDGEETLYLQSITCGVASQNTPVALNAWESYTFNVGDNQLFEIEWEARKTATLTVGDVNSNANYSVIVPNVVDVEDCYKAIQEAGSGVKKQYVNLRNGLVIPEGAPKLKFYTSDLYDDIVNISFDQSYNFERDVSVEGSGWVVLPDNKIYADDGSIVCDTAYSDDYDLSELWQEGVCIDFSIGASPTDMWKAHFILEEE